MKDKKCIVCKKEIENDGSIEYILVDVCDDSMCRIARTIQITLQQNG